MQSDAEAIASLSHIGVVVEDVDKIYEFLSSIWNIDPSQTLEYSPRKDEMVVGEPFRLKLAFAKLGPVVLELIQPLSKGSLWSQFLEDTGEGIHHIAFNVSNYDEMVSKLQEQGSKMVVGGKRRGTRWCYFETKPGSIIVEFRDEYR